MILACQNISKSFGTDEIIKNASFHIEENEKAAIVGINGAGKSTLLKIIMQEIDADEGTVTVAKGKTIGYLAQHQEQDSDKTIYEEVLSVKQPVIEMEKRLRAMEDAMNGCDADEMEKLLADYNKLNHEFELQEGYAYKSEVTGVLKGLGFGEEDFDKKMSELSGGQKTRVALGRLLVTKPDIILLDEPTNHLDMESITALNNGLIKFSGVVLFSSHDHQFVQTTANRIMEIVNGQLIDKVTTYDEYLENDELARKRQAIEEFSAEDSE